MLPRPQIVNSTIKIIKYTLYALYIPVPVYMAGAVCVAEVNESRIYHDLFLAFVQKIREIAEVSVATTDTVPAGT